MKMCILLVGITKECLSIMTKEMFIFNKKLQQMRENCEADIRTKLLVNYLNMEERKFQSFGEVEQ